MHERLGNRRLRWTAAAVLLAAYLILFVPPKLAVGLDVAPRFDGASSVVAYRISVPAHAAESADEHALEPWRGKAVPFPARQAAKVVRTIASPWCWPFDLIAPIGKKRCMFRSDVEIVALDEAGDQTASLRLCFGCEMWRVMIDGEMREGDFDAVTSDLRAILAPYFADAERFGHRK